MSYPYRLSYSELVISIADASASSATGSFTIGRSPPQSLPSKLKSYETIKSTTPRKSTRDRRRHNDHPAVYVASSFRFGQVTFRQLRPGLPQELPSLAVTAVSPAPSRRLP